MSKKKRSVSLDPLETEKMWIMKKGKSWFADYLKTLPNRSVDEETVKTVTKRLCNIFEEDMRNDPVLYEQIKTLCNERRSTREKNLFFREVLSGYLERGRLKDQR